MSRSVLPALCLLVTVVACAPFLASYLPAMASHSHLALAAASLVIVVGGFVAVLYARNFVESAAKSASKPHPDKCAVCGSEAGVILCLGCGSLQPEALKISPLRPLRWAALIVHRWPALAAFLATVYLPGAYSVLHEAGRAQEERLQRERESAQSFATAWSDFRGPLIAFGAQCGPASGSLPEACDELVQQIATGYARTSWYMPSVLADLRAHACIDEANAKRGNSQALSKIACQALTNEGDEDFEPTWPSSSAFKNFMNAYARYRAELKMSGSAPSVREMGGAAKDFYWQTRKLGCLLMFARASGVDSVQQQGISRFCTDYLKKHALTEPAWNGEDADWLAWDAWFQAVPSAPSTAGIPHASDGAGSPVTSAKRRIRSTGQAGTTP